MSGIVEDIPQIIKSKAKELGFLDCGIAKACSLPDETTRLKQWLDHKMNGEMAYMSNHFDKRSDPRLLVEHARSVISVLLNYYSADKQSDPGAPVLSKYAYGVDYHFVMKDKLAALLQFIQKEIAPCEGRCFVDSAPVLDKAWAARAGLGWIGKNTNLISPRHGSFFFIGELIIDLEIQPDEQLVENHCGNCSRCIDACPTKAFVAPYMLDARKCISYQTIENKGEIDPALKDKFGNRVFGCDICQDVCPWNSKSKNHSERLFSPSARLMNLTKKEWHEMDETTFNVLFPRSAVKRTRFEGLKRNLKFLEE